MRTMKARMISDHPFVELNAEAIEQVAEICANNLDFAPKARIIAAIVAAYHGILAANSQVPACNRCKQKITSFVGLSGHD